MSSPHLYFLGTPKIERNKKIIGLPAKALALLGLLAVQREPQTRERILGLLWAESPSDAARKNLRNALWAIRKELGDEVVGARDDRLSLADSAWIDVREFEQISDVSLSKGQRWKNSDAVLQSTVPDLKSKLSLFRGPLLDGLVLSDAPEFEIWLEVERERLAQLHLRALGTLVNLLRAEGDWQEILATARRAIAQDNLQEPMYRALMQAHAQLGERSKAIREYEALRTALERELGVAPLPETEALRAAILSGPVESGSKLLETKTPSLRSESLPPLIGRASELAALDDEFQQATRGTARVVFVSGEIGIGKSRLWQEWSKKISHDDALGALFLETRALESTRSLPFMPIAALFERAEIAKRLRAKGSPLARTWLAEVARLVPEIRTVIPDLPQPAILPPDEERRRVFEAFAQSFLALEARPLVIFIDDAHWADRATLDWLGYLVQRLQERPFLLIMAYRPEDAPASLVRLAASQSREGRVRRLPLARLSLEESAALVTALGGDPSRATTVLAQSAGNPYFLIELLRAPPAEIPPALKELVRARLEALPETAQQVVQAAAVLEPSFEFGILRRSSGRDEEETLDAVDALLRADILLERDGRYDFSHPFVAEIVREGLSGARRRYLHRRAAQALEAAQPGRLAPAAGRLAQWYSLAGETSLAARYAEMAAEHALALAAPEEAIAFYRQALTLEPTPARRLGLGRVFLREGQLAEARMEFETALSEFQAVGDKRAAARAALDIAETFFPSGRFDEGKRWTDKALGFIETEQDPIAHATAHLLLGTGTAVDAADAENKKQHLQEATRQAAEHGLNDIAGRAYFMLGSVFAEQGDLKQAVGAYRQAITFTRSAGNEYEEILGYNNLAYHALLLGDLATARDTVARGLELAEGRAVRLALQYLYSTRGEIALAEQEWDEADAWFKRGLAIAESFGNTEQAANYRANLALAARGRGDVDGALILLEDARREVGNLNAPHLQIKIDLWLAELYKERGERVAFQETLARAESQLRNSGKKQLIEWAQRLHQTGGLAG